MGIGPSHIEKANFEDIQNAIENNNIIINTLLHSEQKCLIKNTHNSHNEEHIINELFNKKDFSKIIFIYGKNSNDYSAYEKFFQLQKMGFTKIFLYIGGLFEWLCLQDIYGTDNFPTTSQELDIYKYRPQSSLQMKHITN